MSIPPTSVVIKQEPKDSVGEWTPNITSEILSSIKMEIMEVKKEVKSEPFDEDNKSDVANIAKTKKEKSLEQIMLKAKAVMNRRPTGFRKFHRRPRGSPRPGLGFKTRMQTPPDSNSIVNIDATGSNIGYFVRLTNIPQDWTYDDMWGLLKRFQCDLSVVKRLSMDKPSRSPTKCVKVHVVSPEACTDVNNKLASAKVNDKKLNIYCHYIDSNGDTTDSNDTVSTAEPRSKRRKKNPKTWRPDIDVYDTDPAGLYGLKPEFLRSLHITPPIDKWVQVTNFRCGKRELEEIMCLAGDVLVINIVYNQVPKAANVMYKHPLQAVQAVSMINDQMHYSNKLTVKMAPNNMSLLTLPVGLNSVGPGLGAYGKPLREIVSHYERYVKRQSNKIDESAFQSIDTVLPFGNEDHLKKKETKANQRSNKQDTSNVNETAKTGAQTVAASSENENDGPQNELHNDSNQDIDMADDNNQSYTQSDLGDENSQDSQNTNRDSQNADENSQDSQNTENNHDQNSHNVDDSSQNDIDDASKKSPEENASNSAEQCVAKSKRKVSYRFESSDSENSVELIPSSIAHEVVEVDDDESDLDQPDLDQTETVSKSTEGSNHTSRSNSVQHSPSVSPNFIQNSSESTNVGPNNLQNMPVGPSNGAPKPQFGYPVSQNIPRPFIPGPSGQSMPSQMRLPGPNPGPMMSPNPNQRMIMPGPIGPRIPGPLVSNPMSGPGPMVPNPFRGPRPNSSLIRPSQMQGPGPNQSPMVPNVMRGIGPNQRPIVPNPMSGQMRQFGPNPNQMIGQNTMSTNIPGQIIPMNTPGPNRPMNAPGPNISINMPGPIGPSNMAGPNPARMGGPMVMAGPNGTSDTVRLSNVSSLNEE